MAPDPSAPFKVDLTRSLTSWSRRMKFRRALWQCLAKPLYLRIPGSRCSPLRIVVLRIFGATFGKHCSVRERVDILMPWNLHVGGYVTLAHDVRILNFASVTIHSMTVISQFAHLCTGTHDYTHPHFSLVYKPVEIGPECWVASGAFIGPGVTVGRGCVIGANAVVTHDTPQWYVCAGNPCKPLKPRIMKTALPGSAPTDAPPPNPCS